MNSLVLIPVIAFCVRRSLPLVILLLLSSVALAQSASMPLLSDIAYYSLQNNVSKQLGWKKVFLSDQEMAFNRILMKYQNKLYSLPYRWGKKSHSVELLLPDYLGVNTSIYGLQNHERIWQRSVMPAAEFDEFLNSLSPLKIIIPFQTFKGGLLFADAYPRMSVDFVESYSRENAVFLRGVDYQLNTIFLKFFESENNKQQFVPLRNALAVFHHQNTLYLTDDHGLTGWYTQVNQRKSSTKYFTDPSPSSAGHPCFYHVSPTVSSQLSLVSSRDSHDSLQDRLQVKLTVARCEPSYFWQSLWSYLPHGDINHTTHHVLLPANLAEKLRAHKITSYHINKTSHDGIAGYYVVLLKTSHDHQFTKKQISDDYILVLTQDFVLDGAFAAPAVFYSPRDNVSFFPTLAETLEDL
ncbi:MAG: hypothetical protein OXC40_01340 [Proteobacteria bacterium]|nr:hypothetical protein [Pseudomonadota bacterium]